MGEIRFDVYNEKEICFAYALFAIIKLLPTLGHLHPCIGKLTFFLAISRQFGLGQRVQGILLDKKKTPKKTTKQEEEEEEAEKKKKKKKKNVPRKRGQLNLKAIQCKTSTQRNCCAVSDSLPDVAGKKKSYASAISAQ